MTRFDKEQNRLLTSRLFREAEVKRIKRRLITVSIYSGLLMITAIVLFILLMQEIHSRPPKTDSVVPSSYSSNFEPPGQELFVRNADGTIWNPASKVKLAHPELR